MDEKLDELLVRAGLDLLSDGPAEDISMRRVAQQLGVSHQAPYVHFGNKRRFLAAVAGAGLQQAATSADAALAAAGDDPAERFHALIDAYIAFMHERPHLHDLANGSMVSKADHPLLQQAAIEYWNLLHDTVAACQPAGTSEAETMRRCAAAWGTVYGIARLATLRQIPTSVPGDQHRLLHEAGRHALSSWQVTSPARARW